MVKQARQTRGENDVMEALKLAEQVIGLIAHIEKSAEIPPVESVCYYTERARKEIGSALHFLELRRKNERRISG